VTKQDILENQVRIAYLGIGSNLGNRKKNIDKARYLFSKNRINILKSSSFYETLSWPDINNPKFLNVVVKINTFLKPYELLEKCKKIEILLGRKKSFKNAPRTCDIDIIDYNNLKLTGILESPHPRMHKRNFVLFPMFELDKNWKHPVSKVHIKNLILFLPKKDITSIKQI
tara:strand:- start:763 stop:1275 length:513 start_codon:yes stop_codon:yes gene_type:complete